MNYDNVENVQVTETEDVVEILIKKTNGTFESKRLWPNETLHITSESDLSVEVISKS